MIRGSIIGALALTALLCACQTYETEQQSFRSPRGTALDGTWTSSDGVFVATFGNGAFTSRFTQTNEILAQGTYTVTGNAVSMQWMSVATQQQRSASCRIAAPDTVSCNQDGGGSFDLKRSA